MGAFGSPAAPYRTSGTRRRPGREAAGARMETGSFIGTGWERCHRAPTPAEAAPARGQALWYRRGSPAPVPLLLPGCT